MERIERAVLAMGEQVQAAERRSAQAVEAMGREVLRIAQNLDGRLRTTETEGARRLEQVAEGLSRKVEQDVARAMDSVFQSLASSFTALYAPPVCALRLCSKALSRRERTACPSCSSHLPPGSGMASPSSVPTPRL